MNNRTRVELLCLATYSEIDLELPILGKKDANMEPTEKRHILVSVCFFAEKILNNQEKSLVSSYVSFSIVMCQQHVQYMMHPYMYTHIYSYMILNVCIWFLFLCSISLLWYLLCISIFPQTTYKSCICPVGFPNWCSTDAGPGTSPHQAVPKRFWPIGGCEYGNFVESSRVKTKATRLTIGCWKCLGLFSVGSANS